ncbi:aldehyde dehydrogenase family protein [Aeromicrobium sp. CTD01-1L150]|uniref:aldehyde dehydrogenase family protein n=1 Tax=Aeromicrobium sp. CTD01-1L150 TaxID=3341830 RepID=UPI0035C0FC10
MTDGALIERAVYSGGAWLPGAVVGVSHDVLGERIFEAGLADEPQAAAACDAARLAQRAWSEVEAWQRAARVNALDDALERHRETLVWWLCREAGATRAKADREVDAARAEVRFAAGCASELGVEQARTGPRDEEVALHPVGVVAVITPFNAPLVLAMRCIAPALVAGNAVVLKPDPRTPVSGGLLLPAVLEDAAIPGALLAVVPGGAEVGRVLCEHPAVGSVLFTGSTPVGRSVGRLTGEHLKKCGLELGGKNPFIVLADADVEHAARCAVTSSFLHSGQICMSAGRYLVDERVVEDFTTAFVDGASRLTVGDTAREDVDLGPLIDDAAVERVAAIAEDSVANGARQVLGPVVRSRFMSPVILADVDSSMPVWAEEVFGPVAGVRAVSGIDEVVQLEDSSPFGLVASVHTRSDDAVSTLSARLGCGTVRVNDVTNHDAPHTPMSGWRQSGNGTAFGSRHMLSLLTRPRLTTTRRPPYSG